MERRRGAVHNIPRVLKYSSVRAFAFHTDLLAHALPSQGVWCEKVSKYYFIFLLPGFSLLLSPSLPSLASSSLSLAARRGARPMLQTVDIVDLGLGSHLLAEEVGCEGEVEVRALSSDGSLVALARGHAVLLLRRNAPTFPALLRAPGEKVCSLCSLSLATREVEGAGCDTVSHTEEGAARHVVLVGYRSGALRLWAESGELLLSLHMHSSALVQIAAQTSTPGGQSCDATVDDSSLLCLHEAGVVGYCRSSELRVALRPMLLPEALAHARQAALHPGSEMRRSAQAKQLARCFRAFRLEDDASASWLGIASGGELPSPALEVEAELQSFSSLLDASGGSIDWSQGMSSAAGVGTTGVFEAEPPALCLTITDGISLQLHLLPVNEGFVGIELGEGASHHLSGTRTNPRGGGGRTGGVLSLGSSLGTSALSMFTSIVSERVTPTAPALGTALNSGAERASVAASAVAHRLLPEASINGESAAVRWWRDGGRRFDALWPDPRRRYIAASDTLGRVVLLEPRTLVVLRVWKGYRDAACAWLDAPVGNVPAAAAHMPGGDKMHPGGVRAVLAIHAPRRELLELWAIPSGVRLRAMATGAGCALLGTAPPLIAQASLERGCEGSDRRDTGITLARAYLLQPNGTLSQLVA